MKTEKDIQAEMKKVVLTLRPDGSAKVYNETWIGDKLVKSKMVKAFDALPKRLKFFFDQFKVD